MKSKILCFLSFVFLLISCNNNTDDIPPKINANGVVAYDSSITCANIDNFLFRDDCIYVDLRPISWALKDGYIAGFQFFPFYDMIASYSYNDKLFYFEPKTNEDGSSLTLGEPGTFSPNYVESVQVINELFRFFIKN